MGSCFSSTSANSLHPPTAKVIIADGSLKEYAVPATASDVVSPDQSSCFLCNSDRLFFDAYIPAMGPTESLQSDQIYFVLPIDKLKRPLTGGDMAALAVQCSSALALGSEKRVGKNRRIRVSPVDEVVGYAKLRRLDGGGTTVPRTTTARKSRVGRALARPLNRLSTIEEVADE